MGMGRVPLCGTSDMPLRKATIERIRLRFWRCLIPWEIVADFTGSTHSAAGAFDLLDRLLRTLKAHVVRLESSGSQRALVATVASLMGKPPSRGGPVQIEGLTSRDAPVLFLATAETDSEIRHLLDLLDEHSPGSVRPGWIGIPASADSDRSHASKPVPLSGAHPTAAVRIREDRNKTVSFDLYVLPGKSPSTRSIEPVKAKIPEPEENLPARGRWFQRRSGGRSSTP
jgi:hypothetical protein